MKKIFYLLTVTLFLIISSCNPHNDQNQRKIQGHIAGIVFYIDDYYVEDFYQKNHYDYIQSTGIKMTYFISKYHKLNKKRKTIIKIFQLDGHEIGFHGTHHIHAADYLEDHTIDQYLNYEIIPDLELMKKDGLIITDFSYPYASHTKELDSVLLSKYFYFLMVYSRNFFHYFDTCMPPKQLTGFPLDEHYWVSYATDLNIEKALAYIDTAYSRNKIAIFFSHGLTDEYITERNATWFDKFRLIMDYAKEKGMHFYTLNDLKKLGKPEKLILKYADFEKDLETDLIEDINE